VNEAGNKADEIALALEEAIVSGLLLRWVISRSVSAPAVSSAPIGVRTVR